MDREQQPADLPLEGDVACPECGAPARITERFWLDSTDGPVEHLKTWCVTNQHGLTPRSTSVRPWAVAQGA
jgi:hypothetical protein